MEISIYRFHHYKVLLKSLIEARPNNGRGVRKELASFLNCQGSFVTQVLSGQLHFSLEQAEACGRFFGFDKEELEFFLLLVSHEKAATKELKKFYKNALESKQELQLQIRNHIKINEELELKIQAVYYSSWHYSAVHMALTIPNLRYRESLSSKLMLPLKTIDGVLGFLLKNGIVTKNLHQEYMPSEKWLHLGKDSPMIKNHHTNLRMKTMQHLESAAKTDFHYSAFFTCSKSDLKKIQDLFLKTLDDFQKTVKVSPEEELAAVAIDLVTL